MAEPTKRPDVEPQRGPTDSPDDASATAGLHGEFHPATTGRRSFRDALFAPVDIGFLVCFRILFGVLILGNIWFYYAVDAVDDKFIR